MKKIVVETINTLDENVEQIKNFLGSENNIQIQTSRMILRGKKYHIIHVFRNVEDNVEKENLHVSFLINIDEDTIQVTLGNNSGEKSMVEDFEDEVLLQDLRKMEIKLKEDWNW